MRFKNGRKEFALYLSAMAWKNLFIPEAIMYLQGTL